MRTPFLLPLLLVLFCSSCYRDPDYIPPPPPVYNEILLGNASVKQNVVTVTIPDSQRLVLNFDFTLIAANRLNDSASFSLSGLPAGAVAIPSSGAIKLPGAWQPYIDIHLDTGIYSFTLNVTDPNGTNSYPILLHVTAVEDGAPTIAGTYSGNDPCGHFSIGDDWYTYTATVATIPGRPHWVTIKNYRGLGDSIIITALVNCDTGSPWVGNINIPIQTTHGYTIWGNGTGYYGIQENEKPFISIYGDTIVHAGDTQTCFTQLKQ